MSSSTHRKGLSPKHFQGRNVLDGEPLEWWAHEGVFVDGPVSGAEELTGWALPGLVDAHNHVGIAPGLGVTIEQARQFAYTDARAGALLLREVGSPVDTHPLDRDPLCPTIVRAGKHIALKKRYLRDYGVELDEPADLPDEVRRQARDGDGWVKLVGDWIDREVGDLAPLWPDDVLVQAVTAAHDEGAKITAHVFGHDALSGLIAAGVDCIEHGTGLDSDLIATMAEKSIALVPTMIQVENFPSIADGADRFPTYQAHMRSLYAGARNVFADAVEAGVPVFAGTDAGGFIEHGRIVDEIEAMATIGLSPRQAIDRASAAPRAWLGAGTMNIGDPADVMIFDSDPGNDLAELRRPQAVLVGGCRI